MSALRFAVLGDPVARSRSPVMHNAALAALGIDGVYERRRVDADGMRLAADEVRRGELAGANITMPHKRLACELSDEVDPEAARARSVNTWCRRGGSLVGYSTDIVGIRTVWSRRGLADAGPVLVVGSGGAAAAALVALAARSLHVSARDPAKARAVVSGCGADARIVPWGHGVSGAVVVNATPLGTGGEELPEDVVAAMAGVFDLAYGDDVTPLVAAARMRRLPVADGIDLLATQAEESFRLWTGLAPPPGIMEAAARNTSSTAGVGPKDSRTRGRSGP